MTVNNELVAMQNEVDVTSLQAQHLPGEGILYSKPQVVYLWAEIHTSKI
jgi:hypothetical protein